MRCSVFVVGYFNHIKIMKKIGVKLGYETTGKELKKLLRMRVGSSAVLVLHAGSLSSRA